MPHLVDELFPGADNVVVVQDNLNTHTPAALYEAFEPAEAKQFLDRLEFHYTSKHGSWLNMFEIQLSILSEQCLGAHIPDEQTLRREVAAWETARNKRRATVNWRSSTAGARVSSNASTQTCQNHLDGVLVSFYTRCNFGWR